MAEKTTAFTGPVVVGLNDKKGEIRLTDGKNVNEAKYLSIAAPDNITSDTTLTFPNGAGTAGQILSTDGNGGLSWVNDSAGNPDGTNGQVQFNDNGTFGAIPDGTSGQVLKSNGAGVAPSFQTDATNSPGGSNTEMQFNDNGTFGAVSNGTAGQILTSNGAGSTPTFQAAPSSGIAAVVDDTTPQLGGNLDLNSNSITGTGNLDIANGTIKLDGPFPTGLANTCFGNQAGQSMTSTAQLNTFIGYNTGDAVTTGDNNTAVAVDALSAETTGSNNTAIGRGAGSLQNGGFNNVFVGNAAGLLSRTNNNVICIGNQADPSSVSSTNEITLGNANITSLRIPGLSSGASANDVLTFNGTDITLAAPAAADPITSSLDIPDTKTVKIDANHPDGTGNVAMGRLALDNVTGLYNTAIGNTSGQQITSGNSNVAIGHSSLFSNQSGQYNVAIGGNSLNSNTASENVGVGLRTLSQNTTGAQNTAIGTRAMDLNSGGTQNVAIGYKALYVGGGQQQNVAVGWQALKDCSAGFQNTAVGDDAMNLTVNGWGNTAMGDGALQRVDGNANTGIGQSVGGSLTSGNNNVLIGRSAGSSLTTGSTNVILGTNSASSSATVSNEVTLGNSAVATLRCNVTSITALSDARDKKDVEDANIGLDFINDLRPVKFVWDTRDGAKKDIKEVGFIAQELDEVQQKHGVEDHLQLVLKNNPDKLEASQGKLIPILVQAIKDLKKEIDELKKA